jgi:hypothetical protein
VFTYLDWKTSNVFCTNSAYPALPLENIQGNAFNSHDPTASPRFYWMKSNDTTVGERAAADHWTKSNGRGSSTESPDPVIPTPPYGLPSPIPAGPANPDHRPNAAGTA